MQRTTLLLVAFCGAALIGGGVAWFTLQPAALSSPNSNAILVIAPYRHAGTWVFDDPRTGLVQEPFVSGVPEMIDHLVKDIPGADRGFRLLFSAQPFPGYQQKLIWVRGEFPGNWYRLEDPALEGWLCPALFKYYSSPPAEIYVKAEELKAN